MILMSTRPGVKYGEAARFTDAELTFMVKIPLKRKFEIPCHAALAMEICMNVTAVIPSLRCITSYIMQNSMRDLLARRAAAVKRNIFDGEEIFRARRRTKLRRRKTTASRSDNLERNNCGASQTDHPEAQFSAVIFRVCRSFFEEKLQILSLTCARARV